MALDEIKERISIIMQKITGKLRSCSFSGIFGNSFSGIKGKVSGKGAVGILAVIVVFLYCPWYLLEHSSKSVFRSRKCR